MLIYLTVIASFFIIVLSCYSQEEEINCGGTSNPKAEKLYKQSLDKKKFSKEQRVHILKDIIENEPDYADALFYYSKEMVLTLKYQDASLSTLEKYFLKIIELCPQYHSDPYFYLGSIAAEKGEYAKAAENYKKFLQFSNEDKKKFSKDYDQHYEQAKKDYKWVKFMDDIYGHPVPFEPEAVRDVCTEIDEFLPLITPDNEWMFFTRRQVKISKRKNTYVESATQEMIERFSRSANLNNEKFGSGEPMPLPFNKDDKNNYGGATITIDNKHIYLTICSLRLEKNQINCDIFSSDYVCYTGSKPGELFCDWTELKNLGPNVNTADGWESQPSISSDGKTLYFASIREGSLSTDIYKSVQDSVGDWGLAQNIGLPVNTAGNEKSPFIHSDSETLYFSSDAHTGLGGYDVFFCRMGEDGKWTEPKNIGFPINSTGDEYGFVVSTDGTKVYFSTDQQLKIAAGGSRSSSIQQSTIKAGGFDIYSFELYKEARPEKVLFLKGEVKKEDGNIPLGAKIVLNNITTHEVKEIAVDSVDGSYAAVVTVKQDEQVVVTVKADSIAFNSRMLKADSSIVFQKLNVVAEEIKVGKPYRLNDIHYATNSAEITPDSKYILDELTVYMNDNPSINIAIYGHTDDVGTDADNIALSTDRAYTVMSYIQERGISSTRLSHKGFGKSQPYVSNTSPESRAYNRRTEFVITGK